MAFAVLSMSSLSLAQTLFFITVLITPMVESRPSPAPYVRVGLAMTSMVVFSCLPHMTDPDLLRISQYTCLGMAIFIPLLRFVRPLSRPVLLKTDLSMQILPKPKPTLLLRSHPSSEDAFQASVIASLALHIRQIWMVLIERSCEGIDVRKSTVCGRADYGWAPHFGIAMQQLERALKNDSVGVLGSDVQWSIWTMILWAMVGSSDAPGTLKDLSNTRYVNMPRMSVDQILELASETGEDEERVARRRARERSLTRSNSTRSTSRVRAAASSRSRSRKAWNTSEGDIETSCTLTSDDQVEADATLYDEVLEVLKTMEVCLITYGLYPVGGLGTSAAYVFSRATMS